MAKPLPWIKTLPEDVQDAAESISGYLPDLFPKKIKKRTRSSSPSSSSEYQADDHSVHISSPLLEFAELLSKAPENEVQADWSVVSGTFTHYDNKNWKNFLRQSGIYLYRMVAANTYETATISRIFKEKESKEEEQDDMNSIDQKEPQESSKDFEVLIHAVTWFLEHDTKFRLGETFTEIDPDKTESKVLSLFLGTTFFFVTPYHLVQIKIKPKYKLLNIWHFWEKGFNMANNIGQRPPFNCSKVLQKN
ncbi:hypothetical protein Avbf_13532 [Armadillidium vulgare]|nr:hypothetical protein Avbf_13532 [Armadillidium vulgare]